MQISITDISAVSKKLEFEVPWQILDRKLNKLYNEYAKGAEIKGFRPGHAPMSIIQKMYKGQVEQTVVKDVINETIQEAIDEKQISPATPLYVDHFDLIIMGKDWKFVAFMDVLPQIDLSKNFYTGVEIPCVEVSVAGTEVYQALADYQQKYIHLEPNEHRKTVEDGDTIFASIDGKIGDKPFENKGTYIDINSSASVIPGLSQAFIGIETNTEQPQKINFVIPEDSPNKDLAGKSVKLKVIIKGIFKKEIPELNDEFAKKVGESDTMVEFEEKIRARILEAKTKDATQKMRQNMLRILCNKTDFLAPPLMVQSRLSRLKDQIRGQLGKIPEEMKEKIEEQLFQGLGTQAELEVKSALLVKAIADKEGITVGDADVQKYIAELAKSMNKTSSRIKAEIEANKQMDNVKANLQNDMTIDWLFTKATIVDLKSAEVPQDSPKETTGAASATAPTEPSTIATETKEAGVHDLETAGQKSYHVDSVGAPGGNPGFVDVEQKTVKVRACARPGCNEPLAYPGAEYCGAACSEQRKIPKEAAE